MFNVGDGNDVICDCAGDSDRILFGEGVYPDSLLFKRFGSACASASAAAARARPAADMLNTDMLNAETSAADMLNTGMPAAETSDADMSVADMLSFSRKPAANRPQTCRSRADMLSLRLSASDMPDLRKPDLCKPGSRKSGSRKPGSRKSGSRKPGSRKPGSRKPNANTA